MSTTIHENPIRSDADLLRLWQKLMGEGGFARRSLWLAFLDEDGWPAKIVVPIDDIPRVPEVEGLRNIVYVIDQTCHEHALATTPMLLSRPGSSTMTESDREWARRLMVMMEERQHWPVHLATADLVQAMTLDDLA